MRCVGRGLGGEAKEKHGDRMRGEGGSIREERCTKCNVSEYY